MRDSTLLASADQQSARTIADYVGVVGANTQPTGDNQYAIFIFAFMIVALLLGGLFIYLKFGKEKKDAQTETQSAPGKDSIEMRIALLESREEAREASRLEFREETKEHLAMLQENTHTVMIQLAILMEKFK